MDPVDYLRALRRDGSRIIAVAQAGLDGDVASCPGWTTAELTWHVGIVHTFWRQVASGAVDGPDSFREPARPADEDLVDWFADGLDETAATLAGIDPDRPAWTWGTRKDVGFIQRRLAHETAIHCWDAVGGDEPLERVLAADGVAEFVDEVLPGMSRDLQGPAQTISLRTNDIDAAWTVCAGNGSCREAVAGDAAAVVTATASDLLLLLWGRYPLEGAHVDGDIEALRRFLARASF